MLHKISRYELYDPIYSMILWSYELYDPIYSMILWSFENTKIGIRIIGDSTLTPTDLSSTLFFFSVSSNSPPTYIKEHYRIYCYHLSCSEVRCTLSARNPSSLFKFFINLLFILPIDDEGSFPLHPLAGGLLDAVGGSSATRVSATGCSNGHCLDGAGNRGQWGQITTILSAVPRLISSAVQCLIIVSYYLWCSSNLIISIYKSIMYFFYTFLKLKLSE